MAVAEPLALVSTTREKESDMDIENSKKKTRVKQLYPSLYECTVLRLLSRILNFSRIQCDTALESLHKIALVSHLAKP